MLTQYDLWDRFAHAEFWWMHLMVGVWLLFALLLFVIEPLFFGRLIRDRAGRAPRATHNLVQRFHAVLLTLSLLAILAAVGGSHGLF